MKRILAFHLPNSPKEDNPEPITTLLDLVLEYSYPKVLQHLSELARAESEAEDAEMPDWERQEYKMLHLKLQLLRCDMYDFQTKQVEDFPSHPMNKKAAMG